MTTTDVMTYARVWRERVARLQANPNPQAQGLALFLGGLLSQIPADQPDALVTFRLDADDIAWLLGVA